MAITKTQLKSIIVKIRADVERNENSGDKNDRCIAEIKKIEIDILGKILRWYFPTAIEKRSLRRCDCGAWTPRAERFCDACLSMFNFNFDLPREFIGGRLGLILEQDYRDIPRTLRERPPPHTHPERTAHHNSCIIDQMELVD